MLVPLLNGEITEKIVYYNGYWRNYCLEQKHIVTQFQAYEKCSYNSKHVKEMAAYRTMHHPFQHDQIRKEAKL